MDSITSWFNSLPYNVLVYLGLAVFFLFVSTCFITIILVSQLTKSIKKCRKNKHKDAIQSEISLLVVQATMSDEPEFQQKLETLAVLVRKSELLAELTMDEIISMKKNLVGESAAYLKQMYLELGLVDRSIRKVKSRSWKKIAKGLRELEIMEQVDSLHFFIRYLHHPNYYLRREARLSLAGLAPNPMFFLDNFEETLSYWEQLLLFQKLKGRPRAVIPDFSRWYYHQNKSIVTFCIEMTLQFSQVQNTKKLEELLKVSKPRLACMIIDALRRMEAIQCMEAIVQQLSRTNSYKVIISCLHFIGAVGGESCGEFLLPYVKHHSPLVRLEALRAANEAGVIDENAPNWDQEALSMIDHIKHPLIA